MTELMREEIRPALRPGDIVVGQELPPFRRKTDLGTWNRYAAVNDEFVPIHMDDAAGRAAGMPGAIGMGNLQLAYLHNVVREWLDERGRIERLECQFRAPNTRGQTVTARGVVTEVERSDGIRVTLDVWTEDEDGNRLAPGSCVVQLDA
jgi:acyl dehydratase